MGFTLVYIAYLGLPASKPTLNISKLYKLVKTLRGLQPLQTWDQDIPTITKHSGKLFKTPFGKKSMFNKMHLKMVYVPLISIDNHWVSHIKTNWCFPLHCLVRKVFHMVGNFMLPMEGSWSSHHSPRSFLFPGPLCFSIGRLAKKMGGEKGGQWNSVKKLSGLCHDKFRR